MEWCYSGLPVCSCTRHSGIYSPARGIAKSEACVSFALAGFNSHGVSVTLQSDGLIVPL